MILEGMSLLRVRQASNPLAPMLIAACLLLPRAVHGQALVDRPAPAPVLIVHRAPGAESCPDAAWLERSVRAVVGNELENSDPAVEVLFSHADGAYSAVISYSPSPSEHSRREIRDVSDDCADLAHATATALTILFELKAEAASKPPEIAPPPPAAPVATEPPSSAAAPAARRRPDVSVAASLGAAVAYGLIDDTSFGALFEATFAREWLGVHAGAFWVPAEQHEVAPGSIDTELGSLSLRVCWRALRGSVATLGGCAGLFAGTLRAQASGFTTNTDTERPWLAVPLGLELERSHTAHGLGFDWRLSALGVVPVRRESLAVSGVGTVVEPARLGLLVQLAVGPRWLF